jgi:O-antigen/teichoic acid export membrane protein
LTYLKSFFKDTAIYGLGAVLPKVINFGLTAAVTSAFTTTQFSGQTQWFIYAGFINVLLTLGLETAFFRFFTQEESKNHVVSTSFLMLIGTSVTFLLISLAGATSISGFLDFENVVFFKILVAVTVLDTWVVIPFALLRVTGRPVRFLYVKLLNIIVYAVLVIFFLLVMPKTGLFLPDNTIPFTPDIIHLFYANLAASFITFLFLLQEIRTMGWHWNKELALKLYRYGWPVMVGGLAYMVNENLDKLMIPGIISEEANGIYAACYKLSVFMTLYITAFRMGAEPFFFRHSSSADAKEKYIRIMSWFVALGCMFIVIIVGFLDMIAPVFLKKPEYLTGLYIVPVLLLANLFAGIYHNLSIWYKLTDRTQMGMALSIMGALFTVVSLWWLLPTWGLMGGAWATMITYFAMAAVSMILGRRFYPVPYEWLKISGFILLAATFSYLSFYVFRGQHVMTLLFIVLMAVWTYLSQVKNLFTEAWPIKK